MFIRTTLLMLLLLAGGVMNGAWANVTFHIIKDDAGTEIITGSGNNGTLASNIPANINSPWCDLTFYGSLEDAKSKTNAITSLNDGDAYVRYTVKSDYARYFNGTYAFTMKVNNTQMYAQKGNMKSYNSSSDGTYYAYWMMVGDPYSFKLYNIGVMENFESLKGGSARQDGGPLSLSTNIASGSQEDLTFSNSNAYSELMVVNGISSGYLAFRFSQTTDEQYVNGTNPIKNWKTNDDGSKISLSPLPMVKYHLVSRNNRIVVSYIKVGTSDSDAVGIDSRLQSPGVASGSWHYYNTQAKALANTAASDYSTLGDAATQGRDIYVGYNVDPDFNSTPAIDGSKTYSFCRGATTGGSTYLGFTTLTNNPLANMTFNGEDYMLWRLKAEKGDPYDILLSCEAYDTSYVLSAASGNGNIHQGHTGTQHRLWNTSPEVRFYSYLPDGRLVSFATHDANTQNKIFAMYWTNGSTYMQIRRNGDYALPIVTEDNLSCCTDATTITFELREKKVNATFNIVTIEQGGNGGKIVHTFAATGNAGGSIGIPEYMRSPLAKNYKFYTLDQFAVSNGYYKLKDDAVETTRFLTTDGGVYYVKYEYDAANSITFGSNTINVDLAGATVYTWNLRTEASPVWQQVGTQNMSITVNGSTVSGKQLNVAQEETPGTWTSDCLWTLEGSDPYAIVIRNTGYPSHFYTWQNGIGYPSQATNKEIYDEAQATASGGAFIKHWSLLTGNKLVSEHVGDNYVLYHQNNGWINKCLYTSLNSEADVLFNTVDQVTYHVVNKSNALAISKTVSPASGNIAIPTELKSPYITNDDNYKYFNTQADAYAYSSAANDEARTSAAAKAISGVVHAGQLVYIGYYYDPSVRPATLPILDGSVWYQMQQKSGNYLKTNGTNQVKADTSSAAAEFLWRFSGNDPYAIYISNQAVEGKYVTYGSIYDTYDKTNGWYFTSMNDTGTPHILVQGYNEAGAWYTFLSISPKNEIRSFWCNSDQLWYTVTNYAENDNMYKFCFHELQLSDFNFHVTTKIGGHELTYADEYDRSRENPITLPAPLQREYCRYTYYIDAAKTIPVTNFKEAYEHESRTVDTEGRIQLYVDYEHSGEPFEYSASYEQAKWYTLQVIEKYYSYNSSANNVVYHDRAAYTKDYQFAVTGDPYELKIWSRSANDGQRYLGVVSDRSDTYARMVADDDAHLTTWEMVPNSSAGFFDLRLFGSYGSESPNNLTTSGSGTGWLVVSTSSAARAKLNTIPKFSYTYNIVDRSGRIAIKYTVKQMVTTPLEGYESIPAAIRSSYIEGEAVTFYSAFTEGDLISLLDANIITETPGTATPEENVNIYVTYTTDLLKSKPLHLRGARGFEMQINEQYVYEDNGGFSHTSSTDNMDDRSHLWRVMGGDPYAVQVQNAESRKLVAYATSPSADLSLQEVSGTNTYFVLMDGNADPTGDWDDQIELMAATGEDAATAYYSVGRPSDVGLYDNDTHAHGADALQIRLNAAHLEITYKVVDKQKKVVLSVTSNEEELGLPAEWKSPLVKADGYHYYSKSAFTIAGEGADATYTLKDNPSEIVSTAEAEAATVYVTYDVKESGDEGYVDLTGSQNRDTDGKMYLLRYVDGTSFKQEKSDGFEDEAAPGIYPYNNGEAGLFVYGQDKFDAQANAAASTRTRWAWYLESENEDPYHVKFSSLQTNMDGKDNSHYSYLRTYKPDGYDKVVTGVIVKDNDEVKTASITASEYMILNGTNGHARLVTTEAVEGERRTVNSFEQYWKNNPTALDLIKAKYPAYSSGEPSADQKKGALTDDMGWHSYKAWANGTTFTSSSKSWGNDEHWFQTIGVGTSNGDGTFNGDLDIMELELDAALILIDNHGWEVMRKPIARSGAANEAERNAAIKVYDSPMVSQYHFWVNYDKASGYHRYKPHTGETNPSKNATEKGTGTSLTQYPHVISGGALSDIYVTYDVVTDYANSYRGADTEEAVIASPYLVKQGGAYAKTADGSSITTVADASASTDDMLWYVKPNFEIDREMGYTDEPISYTDAQRGFDPYNVQIESKAYPLKRFTTGATAASMDGVGGWKTDEGSDAVTLASPSSGFTATNYFDSQRPVITNQTFIVVDDGNGNMRLMPRFDHTKVVDNFVTLKAQIAADASEDHSGEQTTLFEPSYIVTYHIINNGYHEALAAPATGIKVGEKWADHLPEVLKSPAVESYSFYTTWTDGSAPTTETTTMTAASVTDVYVRYTAKSGFALDLTGTAPYYLRVNGSYVYQDATETSEVKAMSSKNVDASRNTWYLDASSDPYAVKLRVAGDADKRLGSAATTNGSTITLTADEGNIRTFALLNGSEGNYTLAATLGSETADGQLTYLGRQSTAVQLLRGEDYGQEADAVQVVLEPVVAGHTYHVINKQGKIAIEYLDETELSGEYTVQLPDFLTAYGATDLKYYQLSDFDATKLADNGVYQLTDGDHKLLAKLSHTADVSDIYVVYNVDDAKLSTASLDGSKPLNVQLGTDSRYLTYDKSTGRVGTAASGDVAAADLKTSKALWLLSSPTSDPYDMRLYNFSDRTQPLGATNYNANVSLADGQAVQTFIIVQPTTGEWELLAANSATALQKPLAYLTYESDYNNPRVLRDADHQHQASDNPVKITLTPQTLSYTYKIYDLSRQLTLEGVEANPVDNTPRLPEFMQSPLVESYTYFKDEDCVYQLESLDDATGPIYVVYTPLSPAEATIKIDGSELYTIFTKFGTDRPYYQNSNKVDASASTITMRHPMFQWQFEGTKVNGQFDPYDVTIYHPQSNYYWNQNTYTSTTNSSAEVNMASGKSGAKRFMILRGQPGYVELMQKKYSAGTYYPDYINRYQYVYYNNSGRLCAGQNANSYKHGNDNMQLTIQPPYTYHVLNLQGKEAVAAIHSTVVTADVTRPSLTPVAKSPLVNSYHYYDVTAFNVGSDGVYTLRAGATELQYISQATTSDIYVTYNKADINDRLDITGNTAYNMVIAPQRINGYAYWTQVGNTNRIYTSGPYYADPTTNSLQTYYDGTVATDEEKLSTSYLWYIKGDDPYALSLYNLDTRTYVYRDYDGHDYNLPLRLGSTNYAYRRTFMLTGLDVNDSTRYNLMASDPIESKGIGGTKYVYLGRTLLSNVHRSYGHEVSIPTHSMQTYHYTDDLAQLKFEPQSVVSYTYVVVNNSGNEAIRLAVKGTSGMVPELPTAIRSPYATGYKYYTAASGGTEITSANAETYMVDGATIYVRGYSATSDFDLSGETPYNLWLNGQYIAAASDGTLSAEAVPEQFDTADLKWTLSGSDPYDVQLKNVNAGDSKSLQATFAETDATVDASLSTSGGNIGSFILMSGQTGNLELLAATGQLKKTGSEEYVDDRQTYLGYTDGVKLLGAGSDADNPQYVSGNDEVQVRLLPILSGLTYHVINLSGQEAVSYVQPAEQGKTALEVPAAIRSPFATNWHFYTSKDRTSTPEVTDVSQLGNQTDVYAFYSYDLSTEEALSLTGTRYYNMQVNGRYAELAAEAATVSASATTAPALTDDDAARYLWTLDGTTGGSIDPYNLRLRVQSAGGSATGADFAWTADAEAGTEASTDEALTADGTGTVQTFFIVGASTDGPFELVAASGTEVTNNILAYVANTANASLSLHRTSDTQTGSQRVSVVFTLPEQLYTYRVYNKRGELAIQATVSGTPGDRPQIPAEIASPLVSQFYYDQTTLSADNHIVNITAYDVDESRALQPNLVGTKHYNVKIGGNYFVQNIASTVALDATATAADNKAGDAYVWRVSATQADGTIDPYDVRLISNTDEQIVSAASCAAERNDIVLSAEAEAGVYSRFILLDGVNGAYELMAATGGDITDGRYAYLGRATDGSAKLLRGATANMTGLPSVQVTLAPFKYSYTYVVINKSMLEAVRIVSKQDAGDPAHLPDDLKSPLLADADYLYYKAEAFTTIGTVEDGYVNQYEDRGIAEQKYVEASGDRAMWGVLPDEDATIYVQYTYTPSAEGLDLDGTVKYNIINSNGQTYSFLGTNGNPENQTMGSDNSATSLAAHTTENRYLWYLTNNDPYDVIIKSLSVDNSGGGKRDLTVWWNANETGGDPGTLEKWNEDDEKFKDKSYISKRWAILKHSDGNYRLMSLIPGRYTPSTVGGNDYTPITSRWAVSKTTATAGMSIIFQPNTKHNYRLHLTTNVDHRKLVVEMRDYPVRSPFVLPDELNRKYCNYAFKYYVDSENEATQKPVEEGTAGATAKTLAPSGDYYPYFAAIDKMPDSQKENQWVDIYVTYTMDEKNLPFKLMATTKENIAAISSDGFNLEDYGNRKTNSDHLYFMVMKTDEDMKSGDQYFLRRRDEGTVYWLNTGYKLYPDEAGDGSRNVNHWSYSRAAEAYRVNDKSVFQEKAWLWAFAGDPYDLYIYNVEAVTEEDRNAVTGELTYEYHLGNRVGYKTLQNATGTVTEQVVNTPVSTENGNVVYRWGLAPAKGTTGDKTFSLVTSEFEPTGTPNQYKYVVPAGTEESTAMFWRMANSTLDGQTEVMLQTRSSDFTGLDYNVQVLPYVPTRFEDVNLVIRRDDDLDGANKTGIERLFFAADDRVYAAGDKITPAAIPVEVKRAFCDYTLYKDEYVNEDDYTVEEGPYRNGVKKDAGGNPIYKAGTDELDYYYKTKDGDDATGPQNCYVKYEVKSDIFLKTAPTAAQIEEMAKANDHVYFMDFPLYNADPSSWGYNTGLHAYFNESQTFQGQVNGAQERKKLNPSYEADKDISDDDLASLFVDDTDQKWNYWQFQTAANRMETEPELLKWYFVGDPYKLQVYSTKYPGANLRRFNSTDTKFQFVWDCVHMRVPTAAPLDRRKNLNYYDSQGEVVGTLPNPNYGESFNEPFYWEMVPSTSPVDLGATAEKEQTFALRFRGSVPEAGLKDIYYYLANSRNSRTYDNAEGRNRSYIVNLSYTEDNAHKQSGSYMGYHEANNENTVIRLTKPVKVYVSAYPSGSETAKVKDEMSEYYGYGETLNEVPRHLQRKFVAYSGLASTSGMSLSLSDGNQASKESCQLSASDYLFVTPTIGDNYRFKFRVDYTVDDVRLDENGEEVHLFSPDWTEESSSKPQWVDMMVFSTTYPYDWLYYDKTNRSEGSTSQVSQYGDRDHDGWNTGLKGLHWALIGDPYEFTVINRRRYEDQPTTGNRWLVHDGLTTSNVTTHTGSFEDTYGEYQYTEGTGSQETAKLLLDAAGTSNAKWGLMMCKTGGDGDYFMRTSSLKTSGSYDDERDTYAFYVARSTAHQSGSTDAFTVVPFSLATKTADLHHAEIRTAVAKDDDNADNDSFDANVKIYCQTDGSLKAQKLLVELRYGDITESLPATLRRYGCEYRCYLNYDPDTGSGTEITEFSDATLALGSSEEIVVDGYTYHVYDVSYVYTVSDAVSQYFTTAVQAAQEEYTWTNTYYQWNQEYSGTNIPVTKYRDKFDHYVYGANGLIIDEVWTQEEYTEYESGTFSTPAYGWLNSHTDDARAFGNQRSQTEQDDQKWAMVGDPYDFTLSNYAYWLQDGSSALNYDSTNDNISFSNLSQAHWALMPSDDGKSVYLALIDDTEGSPTYGNVLHFVTFDRANKNGDLDASQQYLKTQGGVELDDDPTANKYNAVGVKPFFLADLLNFADLVQYHLVIAHQHSVDYTDDLSGTNTTNFTADFQADAKSTIENHLVEYLKYKKFGESGWLNADGTAHNSAKETEITAMLRKDGTLRDIVQFPIEDYTVSKMGLGNALSAPWYMRRQFCTYEYYQRDILRSKTSDRPAYERNADGTLKLDANGQPIQKTFVEDGVTKLAYEIDWVSLATEWAGLTADEKKDWKYKDFIDENGKVKNVKITKLDNELYKNKKVIIDVVYKVDTENFRFSDKGRNTTNWYTLMTNNEADGLLNFTYKDGVGARLDRRHHYTNNYLWAPEGDPYGFVLRSRYATINGTGWDAVAVTTKQKLPKKTGWKDMGITYYEPGSATTAEGDNATYTGYSSNVHFVDNRIVHLGTGGNDKQRSVTSLQTDGAMNAAYEMLIGDFDGSFLLHPTSAYIDPTSDVFDTYYLIHNTADHTTELRRHQAAEIRGNKDANWRLVTTAEQLWPYFERSGYVGGLEPNAFNSSSYASLKNRIEEYYRGTATPSFKTLDAARELVYSGKFYKNSGDELDYADPRPTAEADLPLRFKSDHLVPMAQGYYRIRAFSQEALDDDGQSINGVRGIVGPRYISGYRHLSEQQYKGYNDRGVLVEGGDPANGKPGRPLHFYETDEAHTSMHTFGELNQHIKQANVSNRMLISHPAMRGNQELLPVEYDPASIFYFVPTGDKYDRYTFGTQGLKVYGKAGAEGTETGFACMDDGDGTQFRLADVGGTAVTLRILEKESGNWDGIVADNLKTNYLCIDGKHRYRITVHTQNEMKEIGDHTDGYGVEGIQDTKWLLEPIGLQTQWPYNQVPLKLEVNKGGVTDEEELTPDENYYASICVPFDIRLGSTNDLAVYLATALDPEKTSLRMNSVSSINNMGNGQFVPAGWPVIVRTDNPKRGTTLDADGKETTGKYHVNIYLPNTSPTSVSTASENLLKGQYLEQDIASSVGGDAITSSTAVIVFGLPFQVGTADKPHGSHAYDYDKHVGFYTSENWWRENGTYDATLTATNDGTASTAYLADARSATDAQRLNTYVYANKAYYLYSAPNSARQYFAAYFDDEDMPAAPIQEALPQTYDVYDLQGRKVAEHETPQTLRKNHPGLPKGVYIFGGRKVVVR